MRAGRLRHQITIQARTTVTSVSGGITETWTDFKANVPAEITYGVGREFYDADQVNVEYELVISIRFTSGITEKHRVLYDNKSYEIVAPPQLMGRRFQEIRLLCKQVND